MGVQKCLISCVRTKWTTLKSNRLPEWLIHCLNIISAILTEGVIDVKQLEVISVDVGKSHLGFICGFLNLVGADEALWHCVWMGSINIYS